MAIADNGMTVYWADGKKTTFTLRGDLQTSPFPNTDAEFFDWFGENWAVQPRVFGPGQAEEVRGIRQSLSVDADTIPMVGRLLEKMREGDNEWGVPPGPITDLMMHAAAAVRFPQGWAGSAERRKYLPGSVASDPRPKPPASPAIGGEEARMLREKLAEAMAAREKAERERGELQVQLEDARRQLAEAQKPTPAPAGDMATKIKGELGRATVELGTKPAGKWWQAYRKRVAAINAIVEKGG